MRKIGILLLVLYFALSGVIMVMASSPQVASSPALFSLVKTDTSENENVTIDGDRMRFTPGKGAGGEMFGFQPGSTYYYQDLCRIENGSSRRISVSYMLTDELLDLYNSGSFWLGVGDAYWAQPDHPLPAPGDRAVVEKIDIEGYGTSAAVNFYFAMAPNQEIKGYSGEIIFSAPYTVTEESGGGEIGSSTITGDPGPSQPEPGPEQKEEVPIEPPAGEPEKPEEPGEPGEQIVEEEPEKPGTPPRTGELPPAVYYGLGILLLAMSLRLGKHTCK